MTGLHDRKKISWHLGDLLGRDIRVIYDVIKWAAPSNDDIRSRRMPKRLAARWAAAKMIQTAIEEGNSGLFTHILDRTEGKVADKLEVSERRSLTLHVDLGLHTTYNASTELPQAVEPLVLIGHTLDQQSSEDALIQVDPVEDTPSTLNPNSEGGEGGE